MSTPVQTASRIGWNLSASYLGLPEILYAKVKPTPVERPQMLLFNEPLAAELGFSADPGLRDELTLQLSGNELPPGSEPFAQAYVGHQFGYPAMLGDGRAIMLGEQQRPNGRSVDIQLKGAGPTPYSRRGDGRGTLSAMLREYLMSEAIHYLGIPSTRSLAVVATGEPVVRETLQPGGILTRVASSHIRVGTFEFASRYLSPSDFSRFTAYVINRHYPELNDAPNPALALLEAVMDRQVALVTQWMRVGFIHGVMNTDNMSIAGETIDYGPCAFMNRYDAATVFSSIDTGGRYAFGNQAPIAHWNLSVLASALIPLVDENEEAAIEAVKAVLQKFPGRFAESWMAMMRGKLGLPGRETGDRELALNLLAIMEKEGADYTNTFYDLMQTELPDAACYRLAEFKAWHAGWRQRAGFEGSVPEPIQEQMRAANPVFIPRNHLVEAALEAASGQGNLAPIEQLLKVVRDPYILRDGLDAYRQPPPEGDAGYRTFCNT